MFFVKKKDEGGVQYASFYERIMASIIDCLILIAISFPVSYFITFVFSAAPMSPETIAAIRSNNPLTAAQAHEVSRQMAVALVSLVSQFLVIAIYLLICWLKMSSSYGKKLFRMKIVDAKTLESISKKQVWLRMIGYGVSLLPVCLGFVWIFIDKKRRGFHDFIAGTVVIKVKK